MSLLNISLNVLSYLDPQKTSTPKVRLADIKYSMEGMPSGMPQQTPIVLNPQQTLTFVNTSRALTYTGSTSFSIQQVPNSSFYRLLGNFGARTGRSYGDSTTQWVVTTNNNVARLTYGGTGTAPDFTTISIGDGLTIELTSAFSPLNQGTFVITNVGVNFVEFINPVAASQTVTDQVDIYSSGPVQIGDTLYVTNSLFNYVNQGTYQITAVTDLYVQFSNANAVPQTAVTGISSGVSIYSESFNWMFAAVDQRVIVQINGDSTSSVEVEPLVPNDLAANPGIFLKRGRTFQVTITNPGPVPVNGFLFMTA